jgi:hypothetical protein
MAQMVEYLSSNLKTLDSLPSVIKKKSLTSELKF